MMVTRSAKEREAIGMAGSMRTRRWWRSSHLRRNPLVRGVDRLESGLLVAAVLLALLAVPFAVMLGTNNYTQLAAQSRQQLADRHAVTAIAQADAPVAGMGRVATEQHSTKVPARWSAHGEAEIVVPPATKKGDHIRVWLDKQGSVVRPPLTKTDATIGATCTGLLTWLGIVTGLWGLFALAKAGINRGRYSRWNREWLLFDTNNHSGPRSW